MAIFINKTNQNRLCRNYQTGLTVRKTKEAPKSTVKIYIFQSTVIIVGTKFGSIDSISYPAQKLHYNYPNVLENFEQIQQCQLLQT